MVGSADADARLSADAVEYIYPQRFDAHSPAALQHLLDHGYAVIRGVLSDDEVVTALDLTWRYLEGLGTGIQRDDPATWSDDRWPITVAGAIIPGLGIGQSEAQWFVRSRQAVKQAFATIWNTEDLLTSFDGMCLWRPWPLNPDWKTQGGWLHIDQHPIGRPGFQCIQGLVNLLPMAPEIGGNVLVPGSHKDHDQVASRYSKRLQRVPTYVDHFRYPSNDPLLKPATVHLEPGDLLLWDSRTVHCSGPGQGDVAPAPKLLRAVSLVCMMPRAAATAEVLEQRKTAPAQLISTTNWTDRFVDIDKNYPELRDGARSKYTLPQEPSLDAHELRLVGYSDDEIKQLTQRPVSRL